MNRAALSFFVALSVALAAPARAQISDADRNAARDLYNEGWQLQQAGKYTEALDRYQRSLSVFPTAPTTAYRMAQCKEALGKLVEAAEQLRLVATTPLPPGASESFNKAKQDAAAELQALEPRIPKIRINVQPAGVSGLTVTVDGASMPTALVGVARPVDPGSHTIVASAPGYATAQARVDVRERQQPMPEVTLSLQPGGTTYQSTYPTQNQNPNPNGGYGYGSGYGYNGYNTWVPPRRHEEGPRTALLVGVDAAAIIPTGKFGNTGADLNNDLANVGWGVGGEVGLRLARVVYLGAMVQPSFYTNAEGNNGFALSVAGLLGFMTNPEGLGFYGELGGGLRYFQGTQNADTIKARSTNATGFDAIFGIGLQFKAGSFRFIPKFDVFLGSHDDNQIGDTQAFHAFVQFGISGYWELPLEHKPPPAPPPATPGPSEAPPAAPTY